MRQQTFAENGLKYFIFSGHEKLSLIKALRKEMKGAAKKMDFEKAAELRDRIKELEALEVRIG